MGDERWKMGDVSNSKGKVRESSPVPPRVVSYYLVAMIYCRVSISSPLDNLPFTECWRL